MFDFRNPKRVHSKWFENEVGMFHCFLKSWNPLFETDFKRTWVDLSTLYLRFDYKVEFSKEFEKQSLVCFPKFLMFWKWSTFGFKLELSLISKQSLKRKGLSCFQKCISKRGLPKWFERVENYFIWFNFPKDLFQKELEHVFDFKRKWELKTYSLYF